MREEQLCLLKADYHFHVFHYRMPQTASIAAITPFTPSPLTIKFAMVASLLQRGKSDEAEQLVKALPQTRVHIVPPEAAFSFKAFLRYRSVPAVESAANLDETGSYYPSRPHTREYAIFQGDLTVYISTLSSVKSVAKEALRNIRYLGCKDSLVWNHNDVEEVNELPDALFVCPLSEERPGAVVLLADVLPEAHLCLNAIIPGQREEGHYTQNPFTLPGNISTKGRTRLFIRERRGGEEVRK